MKLRELFRPHEKYTKPPKYLYLVLNNHGEPTYHYSSGDLDVLADNLHHRATWRDDNSLRVMRYRIDEELIVTTQTLFWSKEVKP